VFLDTVSGKTFSLEMVKGSFSRFPCEVSPSEIGANRLNLLILQITAGDGNKLPFLALGEGNKLLLFPLMRLHREAPGSGSSYPWTDTTYLSSTSQCPLEKWFHIGCEVYDVNNCRPSPLSNTFAFVAPK
jgi:hypothetical protein